MSAKSPKQVLPFDREEILDVLKRLAKAIKKENPEQPLAFYQNELAVRFGFQNWSVLHKNVASMSNVAFARFSYKANSDAEVQSILLELPGFVERAEEEMREWVRRNYTPLIEFAFYDNESENGFTLPSEDLLNILQEEFDHRFPFDVIESVATELELDGPWGDEKYWLGGDEPPATIDPTASP